MAYIRSRTGKDGVLRYYARYLGVDGKYHEEGCYTSRRAAEKAAARREIDVSRGEWASPSAARTTFRDYVERSYWPTTAHLEVSTRSAYRYYLDRHFLPRFGDLPMRRITPSVIQAWVNDAAPRSDLSAHSVVKYHALLHRIFARAVIDRPASSAHDRSVPVAPSGCMSFSPWSASTSTRRHSTAITVTSAEIEGSRTPAFTR